MPSLYIHIPFCRKACHYCDFHFSTSLKNKEELVEALCSEIEMRKDYLGTKEISTLYFGGGTPSLLDKRDIEKICKAVRSRFVIRPGAEVTLEANPDDLDSRKLTDLLTAGINRLSIGVQSFADSDLKMINRTHSGKQAIETIKLARQVGFNNLSADLIYGLPGLTNEAWLANLWQMAELEIPHFSAYSLTLEERTALYHFVKTKKIAMPDEEQVIEQFTKLMEFAARIGYIHYEISNFSKPGMQAKHNSSYWNNEPYLGIGPSAHSYDGKSRQWNVANNAQYIKAMNRGRGLFEREELSHEDKYNEYLLTHLRTMSGIDLDYLRRNFGTEKAPMFLAQAEPFISKGLLRHEQENVFLTREGKFLADKITSDLFI